MREGLFWLLELYWRGAILDFIKFEDLLARGYFGMGGGLFWRGAILDGKSLTVQTVCDLITTRHIAEWCILKKRIKCKQKD